MEACSRDLREKTIFKAFSLARIDVAKLSAKQTYIDPRNFKLEI